MKIIGTDNLARETVADHLWLDNVPEECKAFAQRVCDKLNEGLRDDDCGGQYYKLVPDGYPLCRGMEDFI